MFSEIKQNQMMTQRHQDTWELISKLPIFPLSLPWHYTQLLPLHTIMSSVSTRDPTDFIKTSKTS